MVLFGQKNQYSNFRNILADPDKLLNQRHLYKTMDGITNQRKHGALQHKHFSHSYASCYCLKPRWVVDCKVSKEKVMDAGRNLHLQKKNCYDRHRAYTLVCPISFFCKHLSFVVDNKAKELRKRP